jgi:hypothetical protein
MFHQRFLEGIRRGFIELAGERGLRLSDVQRLEAAFAQRPAGANDLLMQPCVIATEHNDAAMRDQRRRINGKL